METEVDPALCTVQQVTVGPGVSSASNGPASQEKPGEKSGKLARRAEESTTQRMNLSIVACLDLASQVISRWSSTRPGVRVNGEWL